MNPAVMNVVFFISFFDQMYSALINDCQEIDPRSLLDACAFGGLELMALSKLSIIDDSNCNIIKKKNEFQRIPRVIRMPQAKCPGTYTIFMLDPDVPGYRPGTFYNHLTLSGIDCEDLRVGSMNSATTTLRYKSPNPPAGVHRYMIFVYRHEEDDSVVKQIGNLERSEWSLTKYLQDQETRLCGPVAGVQFRIQA